jgi:ppGpp synthetase/RelA/SpoT-type nucleotidyltranferase
MKISKKKINQAGYRLIGKSNKLSKSEASNVLNEFRAIHQHPMVLFRHLIDRKLSIHKIDALVSQRLKRISSIIKKLKIQKNMGLSRMQDIGGLRIVVNNISEVNLIRDEIKKVEKHGNFKFCFANEKNYIKETPESGYRSIHMVYKYDKGIELDKQCRVEIQIRTKIQHSWATAVEVAGTYLNQPLKQSRGNDKVLDIFKKISKLFQTLEDKKIDYKFIQEVKNNIEEIELLSKLSYFNIITNHLSKNAKGQYALLKMDSKEETIEIAQYSKAKFERANRDYLLMELDNFDNKRINIVLVSVQDIKKLKQSYPNYFMDTTEFINNLEKIFKSLNEMQKLKQMIDNAKSEAEKSALNKMLDNIMTNTLKTFDGSKK